MGKNIIRILNDKKILFIAIIFTCLVAYNINPFDNVVLTDWDRSFSLSSINSISISKRIFNIYKYNFIVIPIIFAVCLSISGFVINKTEQLKKSVNDICFISSFAVVIAYFSRFESGSENIVSYNVIISTLLSFFVAIIAVTILNISEAFEYDDYILLFINHLFITIVLALPFYITENPCQIHIGSCAITILESFIYKLIILNGKRDIFYKQCTLGYYSIAVWVMTVETLYLIVSRGIEINHPARIILAVIVFYIIICLTYGFIWKRPSKNGVGFTGIIISIATLMIMGNQYTLYYDIGNYANLYEIGNASVIFETFERAKLPVIDYFSAHAIMDVFSRFIYWLLSRDPYTAVFADPWNGLVGCISLVFFYFIIKEVFEKKWAVLILLLYPFMIQNVLWGELAFIAVLGVIHVIKRSESFSGYIIFWVTFLICVFSRYDTGMSIGIGCIFVGFILSEFKRISFKYSLLSAMCIFVPLFIFYLIYSSLTGFNWLERIREWLSVSAGSSATWATASFGDSRSIKFFIAYELFPLIDVVLIIVTFFILLHYKTAYIHGALAMIFSIAYAFMIGRTLIWHNLSIAPTGHTGVLLNYFHLAVFFFAIFVCEIYKEKLTEFKRLIIPFAVLSGILFIASNIIGNSVLNESSFLFGKGYNIASNFSVKTMGIVGDAGKSRIEFSDNTETLVNSFTTLFDGILEDDQTFIDFANVTGLYALTGRTNPCYVSQTPSLLTDEYSQACYLKDIEDVDAPLAIIGKSENGYIISMAGVRHNIRYYMIAEYIYNNYRPFVSIGQDFAIWCKNDKYNEYLTRFKNLELDGNTYKMISPGYDTELHKYDIGDVPFLWANADKYNAVDNAVLCTAARVYENDGDGSYQDQFSFSLPDNLDKSYGQYIYFECVNGSDVVSSVDLTLANSRMTEAYTISFNLKPGKNSYVFRISSDYFWYFSNINNAVFNYTDGNLMFDNVKILEGD